MPETEVPKSVPYLYLLPQFAERIGLKADTLRRYKLPPRDYTVGADKPAWTAKTIDAWDAARPGQRRVQRPDGA
jgi:hypothetical protein